MTPMCTFVPRQLDKDQMMSLFPESNFLMAESSGNRKGRLGQTCSKGEILVSGLVLSEGFDILEFFFFFFKDV